MKISTKARYGLRALVDLSVHSTGEQVPLAYVAKRQELSVNYLEQVFSLLKKAGIVKKVMTKINKISLSVFFILQILLTFIYILH